MLCFSINKNIERAMNDVLADLFVQCMDAPALKI